MFEASVTGIATATLDGVKTLASPSTSSVVKAGSKEGLLSAAKCVCTRSLAVAEKLLPR